jgi:hypothetical protein
MISGQSLALGTPAISLSGSAAGGEHPDGLPAVAPQSDNCEDCHPPAYCQATLLVCLSCGWVACSESDPAGTPGRPTGKPATRSPPARESGSRGRWCYIRQRPV